MLAAVAASAGWWLLCGPAPPDDARQGPLAAAPSGTLPVESAPYREARKALPDRFVEIRTRRFVVLSDADPEWTRRQADLLERTYTQFHRFARRLEMQPAALRHRLVCLLFRERRDYQEFARKHDGVTAAWISGYYAPRHDRVVFYDIESESIAATGGASSRDTLARARTQAAGPAETGGPAVPDRPRTSTATTIHEAVHQLVFHTGIQSARIQNPLWISEGLATAFETDRPEEPFGPDRDYAMRVAELQRLLAGGGLMPLPELLQYTEMPDDRDETIAAVYHQSYALVTWLSRHRRQDLRRYLEKLRAEPAGRPSGRRHLEIFEQVFGDAVEVEAAWLRHEVERTPGEARPFDAAVR